MSVLRILDAVYVHLRTVIMGATPEEIRKLPGLTRSQSQEPENCLGNTSAIAQVFGSKRSQDQYS